MLDQIDIAVLELELHIAEVREAEEWEWTQLSRRIEDAFAAVTEAL